VPVIGIVTQSSGSASEFYDFTTVLAWSSWTTVAGWTTTTIPAGFYLVIAQGAFTFTQVSGSGNGASRLRLWDGTTVLAELGEVCYAELACPFYMSFVYTASGSTTLSIQAGAFLFSAGTMRTTFAETSFTSPRIMAVRLAD
jgi:hypothetical protein